MHCPVSCHYTYIEESRSDPCIIGDAAPLIEELKRREARQRRLAYETWAASVAKFTPDAPRPQAIASGLRAAIAEYGNLRELARESGVDRRVIQRFVSGSRDMKLDTLERMAEVLRLRLVS